MRLLKIKEFNKIWVGVLVLVFATVIFSNRASALDYGSMNTKALYEGVVKCYPKYNKSFRVQSGSVKNVFMIDTMDKNTVRLPFRGGVVNENFMGCDDVLFGGKGFGGLFPATLKGDINNNTMKPIVDVFSGADMEGGEGSLGYKATGNGEKLKDANKRLTIRITPTNPEVCSGDISLSRFNGSLNEYLSYISAEQYYKDENKFQNIGPNLVFPATNGAEFVFDDDVNVPSSKTEYIYRVCDDSNTTFGVRFDGTKEFRLYGIFDGYVNAKVIVKADTGVNNLGSEVNDNVHVEKAEYIDADVGGSYTSYDLTYKFLSDGMIFLRGLSAHTELGYKFTPLRSYDNLKFSDQEIYDLYTFYLNTVFGVPVFCEGEPDYDNYKDSLKDVLWAKDKTCGARIVTHVNKLDHSVFGVYDDYHFGKTLYSRTVDGRDDKEPTYGIDEVITMLKKLNKNKITNWLTGGMRAGGVAGADEPEDPGEDSPNCANSRGAESLGWILCPVMKVLGDAATGVYEKYVEPSLRVEPKLFTANDGVRQAWETFRNIANVVFIILLLVVIFSQLTGVGIDNYGIKKILPKLIVAAILINLSYVVCMVFVDLSNILGNALKAMFDGFSASLGVPAISISESNAGEVLNKTMNEIGSTALTSVVILGALVAMVGAVWSNPAILLSILVAALGVVISIFFLFILLSVREAAVVVLVAISPLALVCYILPNTKKMFDKWLKLFEGLLIVYPICGLLVGGGNYVSNLLLTVKFSEDGFLPAFTAMIVGIVPIFFIPTVLKGSFTAMGNLGAKISGFGKNARLGAVRRMRNGNLYKNAQQAGLERQTRTRAGLKLNKDGTVSQTTGFRRSLGTIMSGGKRGRQRNALAYQRMVAERGSLEAADEADFMLETETSNEMKRLVASGEINNTSGLQSGLEAALVSGDRAKIRAYTDALTAKGKDGRTAVDNAYFNSREKMSTSAARTFANNILSKHTGDYKTNRRGVYELAKAINGKGTEGELSGFLKTMDKPEFIESIQGKLVEKAKSGSLAGMDNEAFDETFGVWGKNDKGERVITGYAIPEGFSDDEKRAIGENIYNALRNADDMDTKRVANLRALYEQCGYIPDVQNVNVVNRGIGDSATARNNMHNEYLEQQGTSAAELEEINRRRNK